MYKVKYETKTVNGIRVSDTICNRRTGFYLVGTRGCFGCSYCYDVDLKAKTIICKKKLNEVIRPQAIKP